MAVALFATLAFAGTAHAVTYTPGTFDDPSTVQPDDCIDGGADCSLREAVQKANSTPADDIVDLAPGTYEVTGNEDGDIRIEPVETAGRLIVQGDGARTTIIEVDALLGEVRSRAFTFAPDSNGELRDLAITGGTGEFTETSPDDFDGGAIALEDLNGLGGDANALLTRVRLFDNNVERDGGAIKNRGTLRIVESLIDGNSAAGSGGAIENDDELYVVNSTISGNRALGGNDEEEDLLSGQADDSEGFGGGIDNDGNHSDDDEPVSQLQGAAEAPADHEGFLHVESSTIAFNVAAANGGGVSNAVQELQGSFRSDAAPIAQFHNSVVSQNTGNDGASLENCSGNTGAEAGAARSSQGHNIEDGGSCLFTATGDRDGSPDLKPLADNGGDTNTHALGDDSKAIDAGDKEACQATDQRGVTRPLGASCDMGAFERGPANLPLPPEEKPITPLPERETPRERPARCKDRLPPITRLTRAGLEVSSDKVWLAGSSRDQGAPCASGVQRVEVSLARVSGTQLNCRFLRRTNQYLISPFMNCRRSIRFIANGTNRWNFTFNVALPPGKYRAQARGYDENRNKETPKKRRNIVTFTVE